MESYFSCSLSLLCRQFELIQNNKEGCDSSSNIQGQHSEILRKKVVQVVPKQRNPRICFVFSTQRAVLAQGAQVSLLSDTVRCKTLLTPFDPWTL